MEGGGRTPELAVDPLYFHELTIFQDIMYPPLFNPSLSKACRDVETLNFQRKSRKPRQKNALSLRKRPASGSSGYISNGISRESSTARTSRTWRIDFRKDCQRLNEHNHIPIVVDQQSLDAAEELPGVSARQLGRFPQVR